MTQLTSLAWKEWRESRWALIVGLGVFLVLPLIGAIEEHASYGHFDLIVTPAVLLLGGVLAVFTAVGATCRDFRPGLEDFWRSRPLNPVPWVLIKYFIALAMVLCACCLPLLVDIAMTPATRDRSFSWLVLICFPFVWTTLFSVAFLAGCAVRKISHATILSLAAMLLIYFVPILLPPVRWMGVAWTMQDRGGEVHHMRLLALAAAGGMLAIAAIALGVSLLAIKRQWIVESSQKMVYWAIGLSLVLVLASSAYPVANNLPILDTITLPNNERASSIYLDDQRGAIILSNWENGAIYPVKLGAARIELGPKIAFPERPFDAMGPTTAWLREHPQYLYLIYYTHPSPRHYTYLVQTLDLDNPKTPHPAVQVWEGEGDDWGPEGFGGGLIYAHNNRLYLRGGNPKQDIVVVDVADPHEPKLLFVDHWFRPSHPSLQIPEMRAMTDEIASPASFTAEEALVYARGPHPEQDTISFAQDGTLVTYRLAGYKDWSARYVEAGRFDQPPLERLFGNTHFSTFAVSRNGLTFVSRHGSGLLENQYGLTVFDIHDPSAPRPVGHFGLPFLHDSGGYAIHPLVDGRSIIGQTKLYLIDKPNLSRD